MMRRGFRFVSRQENRIIQINGKWLHLELIVRRGLPIDLNSFHSALILFTRKRLVAGVVVVMRDKLAKVMMVVYFAALVLNDSAGSFIAAIVAAIEISIHSRPAINNERGQENTEKYKEAFFHCDTKIANSQGKMPLEALKY